MTADELPPVLTVEQAAALLGVGLSCAYASVRRGEIPSIRLGHKIRIPRARLLELLGEDAPDGKSATVSPQVVDELAPVAPASEQLVRRIVATVPRLALSKAEAAQAIGCSVHFLEEHVLDDLRVVRRGRRVFIPVKVLEACLERSAALTLDIDRR